MAKRRIKMKRKTKSTSGYSYIINTDGASSGTTGEMGIGGIIYDNDDPKRRRVVRIFSEKAGVGTNNDAEYLAIIEGLRLLKEMDPKPYILQSDSQLAIRQITGEYRVKGENMSPLLKMVKGLIGEIGCRSDFRWVRREENGAADALASQAIGDSILGDFHDAETDGMDSYSRMSMDKLRECVMTRFGIKAVEWLDDVMEKSDSQYRRSVYKWIARGLDPELAFKKASVDHADRTE